MSSPIFPAAASCPAPVQQAAHEAAQQIAPVWPLASWVAVNPFLGQAGSPLATTGARLARVGGIPVAMERGWYRRQLADGTITTDDLAGALAASPHAGKPHTVAALKALAAGERAERRPLPTIAELARDASGTDWPGFINERLGAFAGGYFDVGQALWSAPRGAHAWDAWRSFATHDLTCEIMGLAGFSRLAARAPDRPLIAIASSVERLGLPHAALGTYFHQLLLSQGGWANYARYQLWCAQLAGQDDDAILALLAIRLLWEEALHQQHHERIGAAFAAVCAEHAKPVVAGTDDIVDEILQEAAERAAQRAIAESLAAPAPAQAQACPTLQAAFCIDVRSEVLRRALESLDPGIQTLGFAGFFGLGAKHRGFASDVEELRLPVLLNPSVCSSSGAGAGAGASAADGALAKADLAARHGARAQRAWGRFKLAAVSSFAFVEAMGPVYVAKIVRDALGLQAVAQPGGPAPRLEPELSPEQRLAAAEAILRAMSLTSHFAPLVLLAGHGASVVNNPHASGLACGACGGYSGEVNARLLALLLNDPAVRRGLAGRGIAVPPDTLFVAALHDTTADTVILYQSDAPAGLVASHAADLARAQRWLEAAGQIARGERALRLPGASGPDAVAARARDWAQVRPEWALAGCRAFIAAPRCRTAGRSLEGRAFLHDYSWQPDSANGYGVLELILTAPVVVASWISLQYYGSTVAPESLGAGNKLLHNVVGGMGVLEGNGGLLRAGLPWQSVHDGTALMHEPLRLSVCIEAPCSAMSDILARHEGVRALFDNRWLHLFAMDQEGRLAHRYIGDLQWAALDPAQEEPSPGPRQPAALTA